MEPSAPEGLRALLGVEGATASVLADQLGLDPFSLAAGRTLQFLLQQVFTQKIAEELGRENLQEGVRLQRDLAAMPARVRTGYP